MEKFNLDRLRGLGHNVEEQGHQFRAYDFGKFPPVLALGLLVLPLLAPLSKFLLADLGCHLLSEYLDEAEALEDGLVVVGP